MHKKSVIIPPYTNTIFLSICMIILGGGGYLEYLINGGKFYYNARWLLVCGIFLLVIKLFHVAVTEKGLSIRFLYIPIYRIRWEKISTAQYIFSWKKRKYGSTVKGNGIFITLSSCPAFLPEIDELGLFLLKHPFNALFIQFSDKNKVEYVKAFREHYPNLSFQLGCDRHIFDSPEL